jgi:hypothetical protein
LEADRTAFGLLRHHSAQPYAANSSQVIMGSAYPSAADEDAEQQQWVRCRATFFCILG